MYYYFDDIKILHDIVVLMNILMPLLTPLLGGCMVSDEATSSGLMIFQKNIP
jgi:hypothetical protein